MHANRTASQEARRLARISEALVAIPDTIACNVAALAA
jgi:hypothetical protein